MSGFAKKDRFIPALCIVLYYGEDPWDAEKTLGKILQVPQACPKLKKLLNDNHIVLLDVKRFAHPEKLRTDLRETFSIIKYSSDKEKLNAYIKSHSEELKELPEDAFDFIAYTTGSMKLMKLKNDSKTEKGGYDVCKAIQDMMDDSQERGEKIGEKRGIKIGEERGKQRGIRIGEARGKKEGESTTIIQYIKANFAEGRLAEQIVENLIRYFALSKRQANAYMRQYTQSQQ